MYSVAVARAADATLPQILFDRSARARVHL